MAYQKVNKYTVYLDGNDNAVPQFHTMTVMLITSSGTYNYTYSDQTPHAFEKIKMLIDLLRNESSVWFNPATNMFCVNYEETGEKDKP